MLLKVMPLENQEPCTFKTLRTPNVAERACVLYVPEKYFKDTTNTAAGTTLKDFLPGVDKADALNRGFGLYLLTDTEEAPAGYQAFTFAKPKTAKQQRVPFKTRTYHEPHYWPDWMRAMYAIEDATVPYEIATATGSQYVDRVLDRVEIIDGGNYETSITVEEFFNAEPTPETEFSSITPQPTTVSWNYLGSSGSLSCLHPLVTIPEIMTGGTLVDGFGTPNARERQTGGDIFPATNMTGWDDHYFSDTEVPLNGGYYRVRKRAIPLYIPKPSYR